MKLKPGLGVFLASGWEMDRAYSTALRIHTWPDADYTVTIREY